MQQKLGANNWNDTTGATVTVPVDGKKPMGAHLKFKKKILKWSLLLLDVMKRRSYPSKYLWQEQAVKKVATQSRIKVDKEKYTEVAKKASHTKFDETAKDNVGDMTDKGTIDKHLSGDT